jgi:hypothetical protein
VKVTYRNIMTLHRGYSNGRNVLRKMSQSFWCSYYCIFSYITIIFFFKSSQILQLIPLLKRDLKARNYLVLYNVIFPRRVPRIYIKHWYMLCTPGVINVLNHATLTDIPGKKLRKYNVYLFTTIEHSIPWSRVFEM